MVDWKDLLIWFGFTGLGFNVGVAFMGWVTSRRIENARRRVKGD